MASPDGHYLTSIRQDVVKVLTFLPERGKLSPKIRAIPFKVGVKITKGEFIATECPSLQWSGNKYREAMGVPGESISYSLCSIPSTS